MIEYMDFSLTIRLVTEALIQQNPAVHQAISKLKHLMVDEYQDVNPVQERLIKELHDLSETLFVVGDDDQAIYSWRGADVNNILEFSQRYSACSSHTLSVNFRSTEPIVSAADSFAHSVLGATRMPKNPSAESTLAPRDFRNLWFSSRAEEAQWVANMIQSLMGTSYLEKDGTTRGLTPSDFAILMRSTGTKEQDATPRHSAFTQLLTTASIPYTLESGGSVFDRPQVSVLRAAFGLLRDENPPRPTAQAFFQTQVQPVYPNANFNHFTQVLAHWGNAIHSSIAGARRRVYPQQLVHDLLASFGIAVTSFDDGVMADIGVFSRIIQDVETVYRSIDTRSRFTQILNFLDNPAETGYESATDAILRRPDAVTVSTVHKVKGLEFPVVFVVDVEAQRFPGKNRSYDGWLPAAVINPALLRGAYQSNLMAEARLFFTALTRAERFLYVTGCGDLPGGSQNRRVSPFAQGLVNPELSTQREGLPAGLVQETPKRRVDDDVVPTSYSDIRYYLRCPYEYKLRKTFGFSPPISEMFGFGKTVHTALGKLHHTFAGPMPANAAPSRMQAEAVAHDVFHLKHVYPSGNPQSPGPYERTRSAAKRMVGNYAEGFAVDFARRREMEQRFEVPVQQAVITGAIDLMLHEDALGNILDASVVDFKSMEAGDDAEQNEDIQWTELALQVQLYAQAAADVLGEEAKTGSVHFLKDNERIEVPITFDALSAAINNVEWAVQRIIEGDFPRRPNHIREGKCDTCDFKAMCPKTPQHFKTNLVPLPIHIPGSSGTQLARIFSDYDGPANPASNIISS